MKGKQNGALKRQPRQAEPEPGSSRSTGNGSSAGAHLDHPEQGGGGLAGEKPRIPHPQLLIARSDEDVDKLPLILLCTLPHPHPASYELPPNEFPQFILDFIFFSHCNIYDSKMQNLYFPLIRKLVLDRFARAGRISGVIDAVKKWTGRFRKIEFRAIWREYNNVADNLATIGAFQVTNWRSYDVPPPGLAEALAEDTMGIPVPRRVISSVLDV
nr:hypothetical protein DM860_010389 [Ipomoea batatas]